MIETADYPAVGSQGRVQTHHMMEQQQQKRRSRRLSIPSHLLWRSYLGSPAGWSGSGTNSRGVYLIEGDDDDDAREETNTLRNDNNGTMMKRSKIRDISSDKRMFHLPCSLRDAVVLSIDDAAAKKKNNRLLEIDNDPRLLSVHYNYNDIGNHHAHSHLQLLPQPRIVSAILSSSSTRRFSAGISCMDLDKGYDLHWNSTSSPPRYLLVGSGGGDCSIALYDLSYFGTDQYLNQQQKQNTAQTKSTIASMTHRPIARSIRHSNDNATTATAVANEQISGVPNGHRQPILNVKWYPVDVYGSFVSASISGEILIWDAQQFVPVFATYTHVYSGPLSSSSSVAISDGDIIQSNVAPLRCLDLPKTPEGCPNGCALVALGLGGGDGRGVIQLCDAFRGGSATHELIGHSGGVNGLEWDPQHPFRLASAGEDCTVRLWDIRKAGAASCLGVLNREKGMYDGYDGTSSCKVTSVQPSSKKRRLGIQQQHNQVNNDMSRFYGVESHGVPVSSVSFTPSGDELVSAGVDGKLFHWDLRPDSCFDRPEAALRSKLRQGVHCAEMDPAVSMGGRLYPTIFSGQPTGSSSTLGSMKRPSYRRNNTVLAITQNGSRDTTMLFASSTRADRNSKIFGYSLYNGSEQLALDGHLGDITCMLPVANWDNRRVGEYDDVRYDVNLLTGGKDGAVLSWGVPLGKSISVRDEHDYGSDGGDDVVSILRRQRLQRSRWRKNCRVQGRDSQIGGTILRDLDTW